jgi:hypothetical protein
MAGGIPPQKGGAALARVLLLQEGERRRIFAEVREEDDVSLRLGLQLFHRLLEFCFPRLTILTEQRLEEPEKAQSNIYIYDSAEGGT